MSMMQPAEICRAILEQKEVAEAFELDGDNSLEFLGTLLIGTDAREQALAESVLAQLRVVAARERTPSTLRPRAERAPLRTGGGFPAALAAV